MRKSARDLAIWIPISKRRSAHMMLFFANGQCWDITSAAAMKTASVIANRGELYEEDTQTEECDFDNEALKLTLNLFERGYLYFPEEEEEEED